MGLAISRCVRTPCSSCSRRCTSTTSIFEGRVLRVHDAGRRAVPHERGCAAAASIYRRAPRPPTLRVRGRNHSRRHGAAVVGAAFELGGGAAVAVQRFNGLPPCRSSARTHAGHSSGEAMDEMERIVREDLPPGFGYRLGRPVLPGDRLRAPKRRCCLRCPSSSCSCASPRCTRAGRRPSRCCWWCRWASSASIVRGQGHGHAQRRVLQGRPHHHHRSRRQERHPDRRVRAARSRSAARRCTRPSWRRRDCAFAPFS